MNAAAIIAKLDKLLVKVNATSRTVVKRQVVRTGGDSLIGRPGSVAYLSATVAPPPAVALPTTRLGPVVISGVSAVLLTDLLLTLSPNAITQADLENPDIYFVLVSTDDEEEDFRVVAYEPVVVFGSVVVYKVLIRSKRR